MNIVGELFEAGITIWQSFIVTWFLVGFLGFKERVKYPKRVYIIQTFIFAGCVMLMNYITFFEGIGSFLYLLELIIFSLIFLKGKWFYKIFITFMGMAIIVAVTSFVLQVALLLSGSSMEQVYSQFSLSRVISLILIQVITMYLMELLLRACKKRTVNFHYSEWGIIVSNLLISILIYIVFNTLQFYLDETERDFFSKMFLLIAAGITALNFVSYYLIWKLGMRHEVEMENELLKQNMNYYEHHVEESRRQYEDICRVKHDMKHTEQLIYNLLQENKIKEAEDYLQQQMVKIENYEMLVQTGNDYVDALLGFKLNQAKQNGIKVTMDILSDFSGFDVVDLCNLLGNIVDNAVEANAEMPQQQRYLELRIQGDADQIIIEVGNPTKNSEKVLGSVLKSTKKDSVGHGYGTKIIKEIVEKYGGVLQYTKEKEGVCLTVIINRNM